MEQDIVAEIKHRIDLVEFVAAYVPLKRAGINYLGLCPFHDEKTPSFTVSPERQSFKCFGCNKGGDIFSFVMEKEGLTFVEALHLLAQKAGVTIPERSPNQKRESSIKQRLYNLNETLTDFWQLLLLKHSRAAVARDYLMIKRGLNIHTIENWRLGYAPTNSATTEHLKQKGFSTAEIGLAGDPARFAGRIIFPICDITGRVIGFTGRQLPLPEHDLRPATGPKYWNTPETAVFHKSEALYGLHLAKDTIRKENIAIIAEGQLDVIGFHQIGLTNCVASSGTALTEVQLKILARFAEELVFAFDADQAGQNATERGIGLALSAGLNPTVLSLPNGIDPAELARTKPQQLIQAYQNRQPIINWILVRASAEFGTAQPLAKKKIAGKVLPWINQISDPIEQRGWLDIIAEKIQIPTETLVAAMRKSNSSEADAARLKAANTVAAPAKLAGFDPLELLIGIIGQHPSLLETVPKLDRLVSQSSWQPIINRLRQTNTKLDRTAENSLNSAILTAQHEYETADLNGLKHECVQLFERARVNHNEQLKRDITRQIKQAETDGNQEQVGLLLKQLQSDIIE